MPVGIIDYKNPTYTERVGKIIEMYNLARDSNQNIELTSPEITKIIYQKTDSGGIILDYHSKSKTWKIMFAAFEKANRGKGYLTECLQYAKNNNIDIAFVEVSNTNEAVIWRNAGFKKFGTIGFNMVMSNRELDHVNYESFMAFPPR